jgi:hypothetical protein
MIKSFRGQLADNKSETIRLSTNKGLTGYKIKKFSIIQKSPGASGTDNEGLVQIWSVLPGTAAHWQTIDFRSPTLLGIGYYTGNPSSDQNPNDMIIIFDNTTVNQDIFVTYYDVRGVGDRMNYYLELEQVRLDINEATVATLKDMRGRE